MFEKIDERCDLEEVNLTTPLINIHRVFPFVSPFSGPLMLVRTNQHLDGVLMCRQDAPLKITTFDMTPCVSHCPQLSPTSRSKTIQSICPPERSKPTSLLLFIPLPQTPPLQSPYTNEVVHLIIFFGGVKDSEILKGQKTRALKSLGVETEQMDFKGVGVASQELASGEKALVKACWPLMGQPLWPLLRHCLKEKVFHYTTYSAFDAPESHPCLRKTDSCEDVLWNELRAQRRLFPAPHKK